MSEHTKPTNNLIKKFGFFESESLSHEAEANQRRRKNYNLHESYNDQVQYFTNRVMKDSYIEPHYHDADTGNEILVSLQGNSAVCIFDEDGSISSFISLSSNLSTNNASNIIVTIPPLTWHTVIALSNDVLLLEIKEGPFIESSAKYAAPWAPDEGSFNSISYLKDLQESALIYFNN